MFLQNFLPHPPVAQAVQQITCLCQHSGSREVRCSLTNVSLVSCTDTEACSQIIKTINKLMLCWLYALSWINNTCFSLNWNGMEIVGTMLGTSECFPPTTCPLRLHGAPPGCGWSVTNFWSWDAQWAQLRCPDENDGKMRGESEVPGGTLNLISTNYPDHGHHGRLPLSRKNAHGRGGNRTRDLMVSSQELWPPSHEAGHLRM